MSRIKADICVVGGGPAGAATAQRLASLGYRLLVVERRSGSLGRIESIAPAIIPALRALRIGSKLLDAGFATCTRRRILWQKTEVVVDAPAIMVERDKLDRILRESALEAGARILDSSFARAIVPGPTGWTISVESGTETFEIDASFVVDARGRRGHPARATPRTIALCGLWRGITDADPPEMRVEAGEQAWYWGAPARDGGYMTIAFIDANAAKKRGGYDQAALYRRLMSASELLSPCLGRGILRHFQIRDATCRVDADCVGNRSIKVGDRSFAMDPISSQGIQAALRSALQAAAVVNTILRGGDAESALEFYRASQRHAGSRHRRLATDLYASQGRFDSAFWRVRSTDAGPAIQTKAVKYSAEGGRLWLDAEATIKEVPVIEGEFVRRGRALCHPSMDEPVAWLGGVELAPLVAQFGAGDTEAEILERWDRRVPPLASREVLAWLLQRGIVTAT